MSLRTIALQPWGVNFSHLPIAAPSVVAINSSTGGIMAFFIADGTSAIDGVYVSFGGSTGAPSSTFIVALEGYTGTTKTIDGVQKAASAEFSPTLNAVTFIPFASSYTPADGEWVVITLRPATVTTLDASNSYNFNRTATTPSVGIGLPYTGSFVTTTGVVTATNPYGAILGLVPRLVSGAVPACFAPLTANTDTIQTWTNTVTTNLLRGLRIDPPVNMRLRAIGVHARFNGNACGVEVYDGTTLVQAIDANPNQLDASLSGGQLVLLPLLGGGVTLSAGHTYRFVLRPKATSGPIISTFQKLTFPSVAHRQAVALDAYYTESATLSGSGNSATPLTWTDDTLSVLPVIPFIDQIDVGGGSTIIIVEDD